MGKRWHVFLEQTLSAYMKRQYDAVFDASTAEEAEALAFKRACKKSNSFTKTLPYKVLHVIVW